MPMRRRLIEKKFFRTIIIHHVVMQGVAGARLHPCECTVLAEEAAAVKRKQAVQDGSMRTKDFGSVIVVTNPFHVYHAPCILMDRVVEKDFQRAQPKGDSCM